MDAKAEAAATCWRRCIVEINLGYERCRLGTFADAMKGERVNDE